MIGVRNKNKTHAPQFYLSRVI